MIKSSRLRNSWCVLLLSVAAVVAAQTASPADKHFLREAIEINNARIELARVAQRNTVTHDVMNSGAPMITDHSKPNEEEKRLADILGVIPPPDGSAADKAPAAKLKPLAGAGFDRAQITDVVNGHRQALTLYRNEMKTAIDLKVEQVATEGEPIIAEHLRLAEEVARSHYIDVTK